MSLSIACLKCYSKFGYSTPKGGTNWWLKDHLASLEPKTSCKSSIFVSLRCWVITQVFEPPTKVSGLFLETLSDSQVFVQMTRTSPYVSYKYLATYHLLLYLFVSLKQRTSYHLTKCINLSIDINSLCNNLISMIYAKIALRSCRLSP